MLEMLRLSSDSAVMLWGETQAPALFITLMERPRVPSLAALSC